MAVPVHEKTSPSSGSPPSGNSSDVRGMSPLSKKIPLTPTTPPSAGSATPANWCVMSASSNSAACVNAADRLSMCARPAGFQYSE